MRSRNIFHCCAANDAIFPERLCTARIQYQSRLDGTAVYYRRFVAFGKFELQPFCTAHVSCHVTKIYTRKKIVPLRVHFLFVLVPRTEEDLVGGSVSRIRGTKTTPNVLERLQTSAKRSESIVQVRLDTFADSKSVYWLVSVRFCCADIHRQNSYRKRPPIAFENVSTGDKYVSKGVDTASIRLP